MQQYFKVITRIATHTNEKEKKQLYTIHTIDIRTRKVHCDVCCVQPDEAHKIFQLNIATNLIISSQLVALHISHITF